MAIPNEDLAAAREMVLDVQRAANGPATRPAIEIALEFTAKVQRAAINDLHAKQVRCLRNCMPNNAPLNTVLKYLDDAKRDALASIKK